MHIRLVLKNENPREYHNNDDLKNGSLSVVYSILKLSNLRKPSNNRI